MGDHLIVQHSAVRGCAGYSRHEAPSILLDGSSMARDTEHGRAAAAQMVRRHETLADALEAGTVGLAAAGLPKSIRRQARTACEDYFYSRLGLTPQDAASGRAPDADGEPMSDRMHRALENVVELVVDGDYEELLELSRDRLDLEDLRRRLEEEFPESLVLPPRGLYLADAIADSDDPDEPGWRYFLDLWTETGPARLHIVGGLEEADGRLTATLDDVLP